MKSVEIQRNNIANLGVDHLLINNHSHCNNIANLGVDHLLINYHSHCYNIANLGVDHLLYNYQSSGNNLWNPLRSNTTTNGAWRGPFIKPRGRFRGNGCYIIEIVWWFWNLWFKYAPVSAFLIIPMCYYFNITYMHSCYYYY